MDGRQLIGILTIIGFYLNQPLQIVLLIRILNVLASDTTNRQHFTLIGALVGRQKLRLLRSTLVSEAVENASPWAMHRSMTVHVFDLVATRSSMNFILFFG